MAKRTKKPEQEMLPEDTEILTVPEPKTETTDVSEGQLPQERIGKVLVKRVTKGSRLFMHDLYKLEAAKFLKNTSYKEAQPMLINVEHCHFYHSHNSRGKPQTHASLQNGHTHLITVKVDQEGNLVAECGPPIWPVKRQLKSGRIIKLWKAVEYKDESMYDETGDLKVHTDDHRHNIAYQHSEELSDKKLKAIHAADKVRFATLQPPQVAVEKTAPVTAQVE